MENIELVNTNLARRGFISCVVPDGQEAVRVALGIIGAGTVGIGGSLSVREIGLAEKLREQGNAVYWHWDGDASAKERASRADYYVCSANALTRDGIPVLTDGSGNRVSALSCGPRNAILIIGKNKIVEGLRDAFLRIRSAGCAGQNARRLGLHLPCADLDECDDCTSPDRICSVTAFFERPSRGLENTYVILVDKNLGL